MSDDGDYRYGDVMFFQDLIYGSRNPKQTTMLPAVRPAIVDMDTIRELAARAADLLAAQDPHGETSPTTEFRANGVIVPSAGLDNLSLIDRNRLALEVRCGEDGVWVSFQRRTNAGVVVSITRNLAEQERVQGILQAILQDGNPPVFRPRRLLVLAPIAALALIFGLWVWLVSSTSISPAGLALGWTLLVGLICLGMWSFVRVRRYVVQMSVMDGNRVRGETREKTIARRIDAHANLKLSAITLPAGVVAGVALAFVTNLFGLKS